MSEETEKVNKVQITFDAVLLNWSFVEVGSEIYVVGVRPVISKVVKLMDKNGDQIIDPIVKRPKWGVYSKNETKVFSREEQSEMLKIMEKKIK